MNKARQIVSAVLALFVLTMSPAFAEGDAKKGEKLFNRCKSCHALTAGKKKLGPSLFAVVGRQAGSESYYKYSAAMKAAGIEWSEENLDKYLKAPKKFIPKNKMPFAGLKKAEDRSDIIAFLKSVSK